MTAQESNQESNQDSKQFTDKYVQANGLKFHYLDWGSPENPSLVLLTVLVPMS